MDMKMLSFLTWIKLFTPTTTFSNTISYLFIILCKIGTGTVVPCKNYGSLC